MSYLTEKILSGNLPFYMPLVNIIFEYITFFNCELNNKWIFKTKAFGNPKICAIESNIYILNDGELWVFNEFKGIENTYTFPQNVTAQNICATEENIIFNVIQENSIHHFMNSLRIGLSPFMISPHNIDLSDYYMYACLTVCCDNNEIFFGCSSYNLIVHPYRIEEQPNFIKNKIKIYSSTTFIREISIKANIDYMCIYQDELYILDLINNKISVLNKYTGNLLRQHTYDSKAHFIGVTNKFLIIGHKTYVSIHNNINFKLIKNINKQEIYSNESTSFHYAIYEDTFYIFDSSTNYLYKYC